jgi:iron(III) transport system substrate-binding protein
MSKWMALPHAVLRRRTALALAVATPWASAQDADELMDYARRAPLPPGVPAEYARVVRAAEDEGRLVVYGTTDENLVRPLLADFASLYPRVRVQYEDLTSTELHHRYVAETQLGSDSADVLWSSATDLQAQLVGKGYALAYRSPEAAGLPDWARLDDQAWATSFEPIAIAYSKRLLAGLPAPRSHADLARLLSGGPASERLRGKVLTYDIERSGLGFLLATQDEQAGPAYWDLVRGLGRAGVRFSATTAGMLQQVAAGRCAVAYNVLGAYVSAQARRNADIGWVLPEDYTLALPRLQFVSRHAAHPNAARLWVDYTLSRRGQGLLAERAGLYAVRDDVPGGLTAAVLKQQLGARLRPIPAGVELTRPLEMPAYRAFVARWRAAIGRRPIA